MLIGTLIGSSLGTVVKAIIPYIQNKAEIPSRYPGTDREVKFTVGSRQSRDT